MPNLAAPFWVESLTPAMDRRYPALSGVRNRCFGVEKTFPTTWIRTDLLRNTRTAAVHVRRAGSPKLIQGPTKGTRTYTPPALKPMQIFNSWDALDSRWVGFPFTLSSDSQ